MKVYKYNKYLKKYIKQNNKSFDGNIIKSVFHKIN